MPALAQPYDSLTATLLGQPVFGPTPFLAASIFVGSAAQADAWLGNPAGTTAYAPAAAGGALAVAGSLLGPDTPSVAAQQAALAAMAGLAPGPAALPTLNTLTGWDIWPGCSFGPTDLVFDAGGIVPYPGGWWQLGYRLILRRQGAGFF